MSAASFAELLKSWEGQNVTIINPESYSLGQLGEDLKFETYDVTLAVVGSDYVQIDFSRSQQGVDAAVVQFIPSHRIKRVSSWGDRRFIQI